MPRPSFSPRPTPSPSHPASDPPPPDELLALLADRLAEAHLASPAPGAALVRVRPTADGVDLGLCPLPPHLHPVDALVGTTVTRRWSAVGVVAEATARSLAPASGAPPDHDAPPSPLVVVLLLDRHGHLAHRLVPRRAGALPQGPDAPEGRLLDALRRALDLPTPPPDTTSGPWWATLWLDRVVATAAAAPTVPRTLLDLAHLHPLVGPGLSARDATVLHRLPSGPSVAGWEVMRRALASTDPAVTLAEGAIQRALLPLASPAQARWFDQGSFARWLEAALPPRPVLLAAAESLLAPRLAQALREAVGS